jgi:hypothetical protein
MDTPTRASDSNRKSLPQQSPYIRQHCSNRDKRSRPPIRPWGQ